MRFAASQVPWDGEFFVVFVHSKKFADALLRSVADLELVSRVLFGGSSTNNDIPPLPFREVTLPMKLRFGYYTSGEIQRLTQTTSVCLQFLQIISSRLLRHALELY